ncbi:MAG: hypothetical protein M3Z08_20930 [Chloroflexota bacterium]|nr:hypothetical protein [Chloroflexota bacterium]
MISLRNSLHLDKLRWLFWLRWKMLTRGFTREKGRIITTIFMIIFILPLFGAAAIGTFFAYRYLPPPANAEVMFLVLTGVYLLWIILPLMQFGVNEGLDMSKLVQFPLTRWEIMASLLFSTLLDVFTLALLMILGAVVLAWSSSVPVALMSIVAMLVFYVQVVGISQLVLAVLMRTLQSRRFRDLSFLLIVLFSSSCYLFQQIALKGIGSTGFVNALQHANTSPYLQWLPPGMAARTVQQASLGNWLASFAWLGASAVLALAVLYLWQLIVARSLSAPETGGATRVRRSAERPQAAAALPSSAFAAPVTVPVWQHLFAPQMLAVTVKELKYFRRDPQFQALLLQSVVYIVIIVVGPLLNAGSTGFGAGLLFYAPAVALFTMLSLSLNALGMDREGLTTLFLFPIRPQRLLFGKNLSVFIIGLVEMVIIVALSATLSHAWDMALPIMVAGLAGMGVVLGCGNVTSVFFPQRMRQMRGFRATGSSSFSGDGCLRSVMVLVMMAVTAILLVPVILALGLPIFFHVQWSWIITIPLSLAYGIAFHQIVTRIVAPHLTRRTPEILAATTRE